MRNRVLARMIVRPFRAFIAVLFVVSSLSFLGGATEPTSINTSLPGPIRLLWGICLLFGGVALLVGLASGTRRIEKAGLVSLAGGATVYAITVLAFAGARASVPAGLAMAVAAACLVDGWDWAQNWAQQVLFQALRRSV